MSLEVVCAGSVNAEEEIGKQLIVIRRRTLTVRQLTEASNMNTITPQLEGVTRHGFSLNSPPEA